jgi:hypothetical protein
LAIGNFTAEQQSVLGVPLRNLLGWQVAVTIDNPAGTDQVWHNVSVRVSGGSGLAVDSLTNGVRVYDAGQLVCAEPTTADAATVPANGQVTIVSARRASRRQVGSTIPPAWRLRASWARG